MTLKNEINENGLDLGIMDERWVQVYARAQSGICRFMHGLNRVWLRPMGFVGKLPKSVEDRPSSVPLLCL